MSRFLMTLALAGLATTAWSAPRSVTLSIPSMDCAACPITVKHALMKLDGVKSVSSSIDKRQTMVTFDDAQVSATRIAQTTKEAGFVATIVKQ